MEFLSNKLYWAECIQNFNVFLMILVCFLMPGIMLTFPMFTSIEFNWNMKSIIKGTFIIGIIWLILILIYIFLPSYKIILSS